MLLLIEANVAKLRDELDSAIFQSSHDEKQKMRLRMQTFT